MIFGRIDYINLLPFYLFLKRRVKSSRLKQMAEYKKSYPSKINKRFKKQSVDAAFISSIESKKYRCLKVGIIAKKEVRSVIVKRGKNKSDYHSATSNILAKILQINGEVIIGDKALKAYLENKNSYIDLSQLWYQKTKLPFVFARLCFHKNKNLYQSLTDSFLKQKIKIPQYILNRYAKTRKIKKRDILSYLRLIEYKIDHKSEKSLKVFLKKARKIR